MLSERWKVCKMAFAQRFPDVRPTDFQWAQMREMFYAGAEAALSFPFEKQSFDLPDEIEAFKKGKVR